MRSRHPDYSLIQIPPVEELHLQPGRVDTIQRAHIDPHLSQHRIGLKQLHSANRAKMMRVELPVEQVLCELVEAPFREPQLR